VNAGTAFAPFLQESTSEVLALSDFPDGDVRRATISALAQVGLAVYIAADRCWDLFKILLLMMASRSLVSSLKMEHIRSTIQTERSL